MLIENILGVRGCKHFTVDDFACLNMLIEAIDSKRLIMKFSMIADYYDKHIRIYQKYSYILRI